MNRGGWVIWTGALLMALPSGWSESPPTSHGTDIGSAAAPPPATVPARIDGASPNVENGLVQMRFGPAVSRSQRFKVRLRGAFVTALDHIRREPGCHALFTPFEADGVDMLTRSIYARANAGMEATWCRHAVAGTNVGKRTVFLCRRFASLPVQEAATILIHEALHWAGMPESPYDAVGLTGEEISEVVRHACFHADNAVALRVARREPMRTQPPGTAESVGRTSSAATVTRASTVVMPRTTSHIADVVDMRSSWPY